MKDWAALEPDEYKLLSKHFTPGREGRSINKIVIHHNAGCLSIQGCYDVWQTREASAHYQVDVNGRIGQLVNDWDTAWHAGDWEANLTSIGIEHANASSPTSPVSEATLENGAHLVAALCHAYKLGRPVWGRNIFGHRDFSDTACPGHLASSQHARYMERAQAWYDAMAGNTAPTQAAPAPAPSPVPARPKPAPLPAFGLPAGHFYGDINGGEDSHGGYYLAERPKIKLIQQWLIYFGCVPGVTSIDDPWADGVWEQPTTDAMANFQRRYLPNSTTLWGQCWSDDYAELVRQSLK